MNERYAIYLTWATLTAFMMVVLLLVLVSCTGSRLGGKTDLEPLPMNRDDERNHIVDQGAEFCRKYPTDIACTGPKR